MGIGKLTEMEERVDCQNLNPIEISLHFFTIQGPDRAKKNQIFGLENYRIP